MISDIGLLFGPPCTCRQGCSLFYANYIFAIKC